MGSPWMYVCFRSDEDRQKALEVLNNFEWKKKTLSAQVQKEHFKFNVYDSCMPEFNSMFQCLMTNQISSVILPNR